MPRLWQDIGHQAVTRPGRTKHSTGFEVGKVGNETFVFSRVMPLIKQVRFKAQVYFQAQEFRQCVSEVQALEIRTKT